MLSQQSKNKCNFLNIHHYMCLSSYQCNTPLYMYHSVQCCQNNLKINVTFVTYIITCVCHHTSVTHRFTCIFSPMLSQQSKNKCNFLNIHHYMCLSSYQCNTPLYMNHSVQCCHNNLKINVTFLTYIITCVCHHTSVTHRFTCIIQSNVVTTI